MNIVFMGTPEFAVPSLNAIINSRHKVIAVVSQPDRESDKKGNLKETPVKAFAKANNIKVYQFDKVSRDGCKIIADLGPDVIVTAAYGQLLSQEFLDIPKHGVFNVHASLLPKYRGSSPIQASILNGDTITGVTIMKTELGMDTGDIILSASTDITDTTTFLQLHDALAELGADLIVKALDIMENNSISYTKQDELLATYTKKITKSDGLIDWNKSAFEINRKINAFNTWPTAYTFYNGDNLKIYSAEVVKADFGVCGEVIFANIKDGLVIRCGTDAIKIKTIQAPGKKMLNIDDFLRGYKIETGKVL